MKTILVTGANGQLGNSIRQLAAGYPQYAFVFTDVDTLDICDAQAVSRRSKPIISSIVLPIRLWIRRKMTKLFVSVSIGMPFGT